MQTIAAHFAYGQLDVSLSAQTMEGQQKLYKPPPRHDGWVRDHFCAVLTPLEVFNGERYEDVRMTASLSVCSTVLFTSQPGEDG